MNRSVIDAAIPLIALAMAATGTIARTGASIDLSAQESPTDSLSFLCMSNGGTAQYSLEDSPDGSVWTAVGADFIVRDAALGLAPTTGVPVQIGYVGNKKFVRCLHAIPSATAFTSAVAVIREVSRTAVVRTLTA